MAFVLDASITVSWAFKDEFHPDAVNALTALRTQRAQVPSLWWFEVRNTLIMGERRGRIIEADTAAFLQDLETLAIEVDRLPDEARVLALARSHRLTVYDGAYLELAQRAAIPLASLDGPLRRAAGLAGVPLLGAAP